MHDLYNKVLGTHALERMYMMQNAELWMNDNANALRSKNAMQKRTKAQKRQA